MLDKKYQLVRSLKIFAFASREAMLCPGEKLCKSMCLIYSTKLNNMAGAPPLFVEG